MYYKTYNQKLTKRRKRIMWLKTGLVVRAIILTLAILGGQWLYFETKGRITEAFSPKVETAVAEPKSMKDYVLDEVRNAGIDPYEAYMIIQCESRWNDQKNHVNKDPYNSVDNGLWMLNDYWHKEVSYSCAYDYKCATKEAIRIYKESNNWSQWNCAKIVGLK